MNWSDLKERRRKRIAIFLGVMLPLLIISRVLIHNHKEQRPEKIGFHQAVYDQKGKLLPWTSWEDALEREMNWYYKAPIGKSGFPVYFYSTFIGDRLPTLQN